MPQAERTANIIELLKWLRDVQTKGATRSQIISYIKIEVTKMGATDRTAVSYLRDSAKYGLIEEKTRRFFITSYGKKWLERHS